MLWLGSNMALTKPATKRGGKRWRRSQLLNASQEAAHRCNEEDSESCAESDTGVPRPEPSELSAAVLKAVGVVLIQRLAKPETVISFLKSDGVEYIAIDVKHLGKLHSICPNFKWNHACRTLLGCVACFACVDSKFYKVQKCVAFKLQDIPRELVVILQQTKPYNDRKTDHERSKKHLAEVVGVLNYIVNQNMVKPAWFMPLFVHPFDNGAYIAIHEPHLVELSKKHPRTLKWNSLQVKQTLTSLRLCEKKQIRLRINFADGNKKNALLIHHDVVKSLGHTFLDEDVRVLEVCQALEMFCEDEPPSST